MGKNNTRIFVQSGVTIPCHCTLLRRRMLMSKLIYRVEKVEPTGNQSGTY